MKRPSWRSAIVVLAVVPLLLLGWLGYQHWLRTYRSAAAFVPADALLVIESTDLLKTQTPANTGVMVPSIGQLPLFAVAANRVRQLVGAGLDSATSVRLLQQKAIRYSLHPTSRNTYEFLFYVPIDRDEGLLSHLQRPDPQRFKLLSRQYNGRTIFNLRDLTNQSFGFYLFHQNYLIGSPSGLLAEQLARHLDQLFPAPGVAFSPSPDNVASVYLPAQTLDTMLVGPTSTASLIRLFLPETITLQFRRSVSPTHWLGFSADAVGNRQAVAVLFESQTPHRIRQAALLPTTLTSLCHLALSDAPRFGEAVLALMRGTGNVGLKNRLNQTGELIPAFYTALAGDVVLCRTETSAETAEQIILVEATDINRLSQAFQRIAFRLGAATPRPKTFLGHQLIALTVNELPATLLSNLFAGFGETWLTQHDNYLVLANSETALQTYLTRLNSRAVWETDARLNQLLTQTLRPAHLTTFTKLDSPGTLLPTQQTTAWQTLLGASPFGPVENLAYQATYGQGTILSTVLLGRTNQQSDTTVLNKLLLRKRIPFNASLIASPVVIGRLAETSVQRPPQIWAQNSARQFVLLTTDKDKLVQDTTDGPIRSAVVGIDWRKNGKLQYLFLTDRSLYVADLGEKTVRVERINRPPGLESSLLVPYSGSSTLPDVVALFAHKDGSIYGLDRAQKLVIRLFVPPTSAPLRLPFQVINQGKTTAVLGLQANGKLNQWLDRGKPPYPQPPGFPVLVAPPTDSARFSGPALWLPATEQFVAVTTAGSLIHFDKKGMLISRKQLYRPFRGGTFQLFPDTEQTGFVLLRTTDTGIAVLDAEGNRGVELRNLKPASTHLQYHRMGNGLEILAVKSGLFTTLYTLAGKQIGDRAIPSLFPVTLQYDAQTGDLYIVSSVEKAVQLFTIRLQ